MSEINYTRQMKQQMQISSGNMVLGTPQRNIRRPLLLKGRVMEHGRLEGVMGESCRGSVGFGP